MHTSDFYGVYLLRSTVKNAYYIGSTPDPRRRLRQHNGELSSGAYRTKRRGYRPWEMVIMVYGFPTKVQALQFEHAWQHAYQSRHIDGLGSRTNHGIHYRLGNLRKLLVANYFKRLVLEVAIMNPDILTLWDVNKFNGPHYQQVTYRTWDDFLQATVVPTVDLDDIQQELLRIVSCNQCHVAIDMINKRELVVKCRQFYHLKCLCKDDFIPAIITVDGQPYKWRDLLQTAIKLRQYFDPNQGL